MTFDQSINFGKYVTVCYGIVRKKYVEKEKTVDCKALSRKVNITSKETNYDSLQVLLDEINRDLPRVAKHNFNIFHQYSSLKNLRDLSPDEVMVHIDLYKNYHCKYGREIQSMLFGRFLYKQG